MGQGQICFGKLLEVRGDAAASCHHNNIVAGLKQVLIEPVDFPQTAAGPVADHGMAQLFTGGDAHPIHTQAVGSGVKHQHSVGKTLGSIEPAENVLQFQRAGKFHTLPPCTALGNECNFPGDCHTSVSTGSQ